MVDILPKGEREELAAYLLHAHHEDEHTFFRPL